MIDHTKPMRLSDGTPVTFQGLDTIPQSGTKQVIWIKDVHGHNYQFNFDGTHAHGLKKERLENYVPFDPSKPCETRDGRPARIICTDCSGSKPIVALIGATESVATRHADGSVSRLAAHGADLVNVEPTVTSYIHLGHGYENYGGAKRSTCYDDPVVRIERQGDKIVSAEIVTQ